FAVALPLAVGVWFVDRELIVWLLHDEYAEVARTFSVLVCGLLGQTLIFVFATQVLLFQRQVRHINVVMGLALVAGIALALALVGPLGYTGVALGNALGRTVAGIAALLLARQYLDHLPWRDLMGLGVATAVMAGALFVLPPSEFIVTIAVAVVVYAGALLAINRQRVSRLGERMFAALRR